MMKYKYLLVGCTFFLMYFFIKKDNTSTTVNETIKSKKAVVAEIADDKYSLEKLEAKRNKQPKKYDDPDKFAEFHRLIRTRDGESGPNYKSNYKIKELKQAHARYSSVENARQADLPWIERGPGNVGGRTRDLLVLPSDPTNNTWLAGAAGGGIWKTTNSGDSWVYKSTNFPTLAIATMVQAKGSPGVIYAGTGEDLGGGIIGDGIFKSTDDGETWSQIASTSSDARFNYVTRIVVNPDDANTMVVCTTGVGSNAGDKDSYILKTTDGGTSWTQVHHEASVRIDQVVRDPSNFNILYASINEKGIYKSIDAGDTWTNSSTGIVGLNGRMEIGIAPTNTSRIYLSAEGSASGNASDLFVSDDAGANWELVLMPNSGTNVDFLGGQGWYDNVVEVDPYNEDVVYYGGVNLWRNTISADKAETTVVNISVDDTETTSFFSVVNFGGSQYGGGLDLGESPVEDFVSIEIRFGGGATQKAHRFTIPAGATSGVAAADYTYADYVDVPFEVWDTDNNKQLMVSFRDQQDDGIFQLYERGGANEAREYLFISSLAYDAAAPNDNMTVPAGHETNQLYFFWPVLTAGGTWDPANMAASKLIINYDKVVATVRNGLTRNISDAYIQYDSINTSFYNPNPFHPDQHGLVMVKVDEAAKTYKIINTSDGGVFESNAGTEPGLEQQAFTFKSIGYNTTQFYGADKKPGGNEYLAGAQDNGTFLSKAGEDASSTTEYREVISGDGFKALWNYADPLKLIGGSQFNGFRRSFDGGLTWPGATGGLNGNGPFISNLVNSNSKPDVVFTTTSNGIFRTSNFGQAWSLSSAEQDNLSSFYVPMSVSLANPDIVWSGRAMSSTAKLQVSIDNGLTFKSSQSYTDVPLGSVSGIETHPTEPNTAYALFSFGGAPKVLRTKDLGQTWEDISGFGQNDASSNGFPDVPIYSLLVLPHETSTIWVGTEIGIFESKDDGVTWAYANNGFPAVAVWQMKISDDQVVVATHGRGIWSVTIPEIPSITVSPSLAGIGTAVEGGLNILVSLKSSYDKSEVYVDGILASTIEANSEPINKTINIQDVSTTEFLDVEIWSYKNSVVFKSSKDSTMVFETNPIQSEYSDDLNSGSTDYYIEDKDFVISKFSGFDNIGMHSKHDYEEGIDFPGGNKNYISILRTPVKINAENAILSYKDVAIVEKGEPDIPFGIAEFWDYVIVEGTTDGFTWTPVINGYDASFDPTWLATYDAGNKGDATMFVRHNINLLDTYKAGDEVMFRFRLFSDNLTVGYGWVVDDISIQGTITSIPELIEKTSLSVYPNPSNNNLTVTFDLPKSARTSVKILGIDGQVIASHEMNVLNKGKSEKTIDIQNLKHGMYLLSLETDFGKITKRFVKD
jgi:photosystem II stability/assembly factor-like uncharacterized protein